MADLGEKDRSGSTKISGSDSTGLEDNYLDVDATGRVTVKLNDASGSAINLGQAAMANSVPVVIASNQSAISVSDVLNTAGQSRAQAITTTAAEALGAATILTNRKILILTPTNGTIYWGFSNTVTTSSGTPIFKNQMVAIAVTSNVHVYVIAGSTVDCRIAEAS